MRDLSFAFILPFFVFVLSFVANADTISDTEIHVSLEPSCAGNLTYDICIADSLAENPIPELVFTMDLFAGWKCVDTLIDYDADGMPIKLQFIAEKLPRSILADTIIISEIFFCAHLDDTLYNWFELVNISDREISLENAMIQTVSGKHALVDDLVLLPKSCVKIVTDSLMMNFNKDSLLLFDSSNRVISAMYWDASLMNLPQDSLFSLEIIDVFKSSDDVLNWEILYGHGSGGICPIKYLENIGEDSIWNWLQYVVWAFAAVLLVLVVGFSVKQNKK